MRAVVVYQPPLDNTRAVAQAVARASTEPSTLPSCRQVIITGLLFDGADFLVVGHLARSRPPRLARPGQGR